MPGFVVHGRPLSPGGGGGGNQRRTTAHNEWLGSVTYSLIPARVKEQRVRFSRLR